MSARAGFHRGVDEPADRGVPLSTRGRKPAGSLAQLVAKFETGDTSFASKFSRRRKADSGRGGLANQTPETNPYSQPKKQHADGPDTQHHTARLRLMPPVVDAYQGQVRRQRSRSLIDFPVSTSGTRKSVAERRKIFENHTTLPSQSSQHDVGAIKRRGPATNRVSKLP